MSTREFAIIDPTEGVLFRAPYFDDALRQNDGLQVVGVLTLQQVSVIIDVVRQLNMDLGPRDLYRVGLMPDHMIALIGEDELVSREPSPVTLVMGIVAARTSLSEFREKYEAELLGQDLVQTGKRLAA